MQLADLQSRVRDALVIGESAPPPPFLTGGRDGNKRLAIHQRHYESSLVKALLGKFPATAWLIGSDFLTDAARRFVHRQPPTAPCIAEYGETFPAFLAESPATEFAPYVGSFAELEWALGHAAVAVDAPSLSIEEFSTQDPDSLMEASVVSQPGIRYLEASWPIDELMKLYLTESSPDRFELGTGRVCIEVHGSRGEFQINCLKPAEYIFRKTLSTGRPIGDSADSALDLDPAFDPGQALATLVATGWITRILHPLQKEQL